MKKKQSLLELGELAMAQSMLVFLLADLRILSATGRIRTKYEHLYIDSDKARKKTGQDFAGYTAPDYESEGVTAAHLMGVLLLEITREADDIKANQASGKEVDMRKSVFVDEDLKTRTISDRAGVKSAIGLPALLHCYRDMVEADFKVIKDEYPKVRKSDYPLNILPHGRPSLRDAKVRKSDHFRASIFNPDVGDFEDDDKLFPPPPSFLKNKRPTMARVLSRQNVTLQSIVAMNNIIFHGSGKDGDEEFYKKDELMKLIEEALEERNSERLGFLRDFFKDGTVSQVLVKSKAEMVWLNDWHTSHECTYAISIDKEEKRVVLAFRGAYTKSDWSHLVDMKTTATSNPIFEDYEDRPDTIKLYKGLHRYIFRIRKDTGTTKYDEIVSKVAQYFDLVGEGTTLLVTGHSLGAALTTMFSLYASTDDRFTGAGPVEAVTWGGPFVGGYQFGDAVRHQENMGKLRIARFHNIHDGVPSLPPAGLFSRSRKGAKFFHNGINITLPMIHKGCFKAFGQPQPYVTYNGYPKSKMQSWLRQMNWYYFWNIPFRPWKIPEIHTLVEHKKRLHLIYASKDGGKNSPLVRYSLEELYAMRHELKNIG